MGGFGQLSCFVVLYDLQSRTPARFAVHVDRDRAETQVKCARSETDERHSTLPRPRRKRMPTPAEPERAWPRSAAPPGPHPPARATYRNFTASSAQAQRSRE